MVPSEDSFYEPPEGYEHARPGTVLRSPRRRAGVPRPVPQKFRATQLLYRTTDFQGDPQASVTTVLIPTERDPDGRCR